MKIFVAMLIGLFLLVSCEKKELDSGINPYDPENPGFVLPSFTIIKGPENQAIVNSDEITFEWQGNQADIEYSYRFREQRNATWNDWSEWQRIKSVTFGPLDELTYEFELKCKYPGDGAATGKDEVRAFTVDAVKGPAILCYPKKQEVRKNDIINVYIMAEEVQDLTIADFKMVFSSQLLSLQSIEKGGLLEEPNNMILLTKPSDPQAANDSGLLVVSLGLINQQNGFTGTKDMCVLKFKAKAKGTTEITFNNIHFRDYQNNEIADINSGKAQIIIE